MKIFTIGLLITFTTLNISCDNRKSNLLNCIDSLNEIEISHTDDKYGEWGGDTDLILIYSDGNELYAKYSRYLGSDNSPLPPDENEEPKKWYEYGKLEFTIDSIRLNYSDKELIEKVIFELLKSRLRNPTSFTNGGIYNYVVTKDSSLIIQDYPSIKWENFQKLKAKLKNR